MSLELVATGFVMGLAGAGHCAVMCGPVCAAMAGRAPGRAAPQDVAGGAVERSHGRSVIVRFERHHTGAVVPAAWSGAPDGLLVPVHGRTGLKASGPPIGWAQRDAAWLVFLASRVASYAAGGALVAASVAWLASLGSSLALLRPFWVLLQVGVLALGLWLLVAGRQPPFLVAAAEALRRRGGNYGPAETGDASTGRLRRAATAGAAWVLVPCGLLQSALVTASLASTPWAGGAVMAAFALASSAGLIGAPVVVALLRRVGGRSGERAVTRLAGAMLAGAAAWALWMLVSAPLAAAVCVV